MANVELSTVWDVGTLAGLDDGALLDRFTERTGRGSELAFEVLVLRHGPMVLRVCGQLLGDRHAAEDAFQAVFVVLARRARSIRRPERLGPWLYGVALRTAKESRKREEKRRRLERRGANMPPPTDPDPPEYPLVRSEEAEVLHREIARLPERYRVPVVLCDLEGLTQQEAATRLRCPLGTLAIRLKRARERLRDRLGRRGLDPAAALMGLTLAPNSIPILSTNLVQSTVRASTAAGVASASVISLAEGVLLTMTWARGKLSMAGAGLILTLGLAAAWGASGGQEPGPPVDKTPEVDVALPITREVRDSRDFVGRLDASKSQEIRSQVDGTLAVARFEQGARVKVGDLMFEIDRTSHQATLDVAEAGVLKASAQAKLADAVASRNKTLMEKNPNFVSQEEKFKAIAEQDVAKANLQLAEVSRDRAKRLLDATQIKAPFDGIVAAVLAIPGREIEAGKTGLANLVSIDPIAVVFDIDEWTLLRLRRSKGEELAKGLIDLPIQVGLSFQEGFPLRGTARFGGESVNPETGTARLRGTIPNADQSLRTGLLARVRLITGPPQKAVLVPERAVSSDGGRKFLHVLDARDVVEARTVTLGPLHDDLRIVKEGLKADERIIVGNVKEIRPGMTIKPRPSPGP